MLVAGREAAAGLEHENLFTAETQKARRKPGANCRASALLDGFAEFAGAQALRSCQWQLFSVTILVGSSQECLCH
jgi:hypothetical protein